MEINVCVFHLIMLVSVAGDCFETRFVGNPKGRLSRDEAHLVVNIHLN